MHESWNGQIAAYTTEVTDKDFEQPRALWDIICKEKDGKKEFLNNIVPSLAGTEESLRKEAIGRWPFACILMIHVADSGYSNVCSCRQEPWRAAYRRLRELCSRKAIALGGFRACNP
jgi:hypothetical protein